MFEVLYYIGLIFKTELVGIHLAPHMKLSAKMSPYSYEEVVEDMNNVSYDNVIESLMHLIFLH